jgi:DNA-binding NarL/FixJ family response regulator
MNTLTYNMTGKHTIWIVEDDTQFGDQLFRLINMSDLFTCDKIFRACEPALEAIRTDIPPDILLMDIGLPGMSGIEGVRRIKAVTPIVHVIILTVFEDSENIVNAIEAGAGGYLLKGSSLEEIVESLKFILNGGAPINPQIARIILGLFRNTSSIENQYDLTIREKEVLSLLVEGLTKKQIAGKLFVSYNTIGKHVSNIYLKLQVQTRGSAVAKTIKERLL